jgi:hypothetical protein
VQIIIIKQEVKELKEQYCYLTPSLFIEAENKEKNLNGIIQYWQILQEPVTYDQKELEILPKSHAVSLSKPRKIYLK